MYLMDKGAQLYKLTAMRSGRDNVLLVRDVCGSVWELICGRSKLEDNLQRDFWKGACWQTDQNGKVCRLDRRAVNSLNWVLESVANQREP